VAAADLVLALGHREVLAVAVKEVVLLKERTAQLTLAAAVAAI
jgi:hypothetical protein